MTALACAVRADHAKTDRGCETRNKCVKCTAVASGDVGREGGGDGGGFDEGACWWSTERQACLQPTTGVLNATEPLVLDPADCPRFVVVGDGRATSGEPYAYRLDVSNDAAAGLVSYLGRVGFACLTDGGGRLSGRASGRALERDGADGGEIACDPVVRPRQTSAGDDDDDDDDRPSVDIGHFYVQFGPYNATLRLDHDADYYVTFYDRDCLTVGDEGDGGYENGCVDCSWTAGDYRYYVKRCSSRNQCVGPFEYYDRRYLRGVDRHVTSWMNGVRTKCERAITIESFEPAEAPWTATEVNVTVAVRNHRVLAEGATVNVTVAGRACVDPLTSPEDEDALTCTVSTAGPAAAVGVDGPVRVVYAAGQVLTVESAAKFRFVAPAVTGLVGPPCGPTRGGTALTVIGAGFNASRTVRVFVQWADGTAVPCRVVRTGHDYVKCSTAAAEHGPTGRGRVRADFDGPVSLFAPGRGFAYADTPRPADDGQRLSGIASGGTLVAVRWVGLECLIEGGMVIFYVYPHRAHRMCWAREDALVCQSPALADLVHSKADRYSADSASDDGGADDGGTEDGGAADGGAEDGGAVDGGAEDGGAEDGGAEDGGPKDGAPVALFKCDFGVRFAGDTVHQRCPEPGYAVYADPRFADFEVTDGKVVIYGRGELGLGFGVSDVSVEFRDRDAGECEVEWMGRDRIVCAAEEPTIARLVAGDLREVLVKVGHAATVAVPSRARGDGASLTDGRRVLRHVTVAAAVALLAALGYVASLWWRKKRNAARRADAVTDAVRLSDMPAEVDDVSTLIKLS